MVSLKKFRLMAIAGLAALAFVFIPTGSAWAVLGDGTWNGDFLPNQQQLSSPGGYHEVRNGGLLFQAWRAADSSGNLWAAWSRNGQTGAAVHVNWPSGVSGMVDYPTVAGSRRNSFQIAFTATNGHIYRATFSPTSTSPSYNNLEHLDWQDTRQTSFAAPALAQGGTNSAVVGMAWIANNSTRQILFATWSADTFAWSSTTTNLLGSSWYGPALTFTEGQYVAAHTGDNSQIYVATRLANTGPNNWTPWASTGPNAFYLAPAMAAAGDGNIILAATDLYGNVNYMQLSRNYVITIGWRRDNFQTNFNVTLSADGNNVYAIAAGRNPVGNAAYPEYYNKVYHP